jgi:two-component system, LuxR family, response regulator FixJ
MSDSRKEAPMTVFVVDDDEAVRDSLSLLLESYGLYVETFASTDAFAAAAKPGRGRCLILDQNLIGTTGLDYLASRGERGIGLPVILITGQGSHGVRARALELGVAAYLEKPIDDEALIAAIRSVSGRAN